jgi:hypothetical protein
MDADIKTAVCTEYESLLKESHQALSEFNEHLAGVLTIGVGGKKWDNELLKRQAKYAKAYHHLQNHARDCELCQFVLRMQLRPAA